MSVLMLLVEKSMNAGEIFIYFDLIHRLFGIMEICKKNIMER